ncbi:uncharacterized protein LOC141532930 [Cotesia typhae]|uniref:uncharacterized protein LOC141532930 n=1 Tax=Cotesia typhae TaxID=2053667 RepID=UPI003D685C53
MNGSSVTARIQVWLIEFRGCLNTMRRDVCGMINQSEAINLNWLGFGTRGTSSGRSNAGRVSPTQANVGGHHVWGPSHSHRGSVQPRHSLSRPQNPLNPGSLRHQSPVYAGPSRPQSSVDHAQPSTRNHFPTLATPKFTHADAAKRGSEILKSSSSTSISSGNSGYNSGSGRSSITSSGSFSSGSSSSLNRPEPIGLNVIKSTASMTSRASRQSCIDKTKTIPQIIAPAEKCFDYFKLAVSWAPSFAYKERKKGLHIRNRIHASWFIHGLWPTMFQRYQDPMPGCRRFDITFNKNRFVDHKILGPLENTWYTVLAKGWSNNNQFWEHEFNKHGSCASRSSVIGDDVNYFKRTLELFNQLNIGTILYANGIRVGATVNLKDIVNTIEDRIGAKIQFDLVTK